MFIIRCLSSHSNWAALSVGRSAVLTQCQFSDSSLISRPSRHLSERAKQTDGRKTSLKHLQLLQDHLYETRPPRAFHGILVPPRLDDISCIRGRRRPKEPLLYSPYQLPARQTCRLRPGTAVAMRSACERGHEMLGRSQPSVSRQPGDSACLSRSPRPFKPPACFAELGLHRPEIRMLDLQRSR